MWVSILKHEMSGKHSKIRKKQRPTENQKITKYRNIS